MGVKEIEKEIKDCPETIFDTFKLTIDLRTSGAGMREELVNLVNQYARINQLSTNALFLYEKAKNRKEAVESLAWAMVPRDEKITKQKILVRSIIVEIDGQKTSINEEELRVNNYYYIYNRGKDKVKEISSVLDVGRTLLSWDKQEAGQYK